MILLLFKRKENKVYDITNLTGEKTWSGEKQKAPRDLSFTFYKKDYFDVNVGDVAILLNDSKKELFRGFVLGKSIGPDRQYGIKVYDSLFHWTKNKDTFTFNNKNLSQIFVEVCKRFSSSYWDLPNTPFVIKELLAPNRTAYDIMKEAMSITYKNTGIRYYLRDKGGRPELVQRKEQVYKWILATGSNITNYSINESAEEMCTRVKLYYQDPKTKKTTTISVQNDDLARNFGVLQHFEQVSEQSNSAQLKTRANTILAEKGRIDRKFTIETLGIDEVISGSAIIVNIPELDIKKTYYVERDTHKFNGRVHTMSLTLSETNEL